MKKRRVTCGVIALLIVLAVAAVASVLFSRSTRGNVNRPAGTDLSYAVIAAPLDGETVFVGDPVYVQVSAMLSHRNPGGLELRVDGEKYVPQEQDQPYAPRNQFNCPSQDPNFCGTADFRLLWVPASASLHTLSACIFGEEQPTPAWTICSDPVRVAVVDLSAPPPTAGKYAPQPGDTLETTAGNFGLPPQLVAVANPGIDPIGPLSKDTPVNVPSDPSLPLPSTPSSGSGSASAPWTVSQARLTSGQPIDKGYCYYSLGSNYWSRLPAGPHTFAYPVDGWLDLAPDLHSLSIPPAGGTLAMECWGWSGTSLSALGSGKTTFTPSASPTIQLNGDQFTLDVTLETIPGDFEPRDLKYMISPPSGVTATSNVEVCISHIPPDALFLVWLCKAAVEKGDTILVWEWVAPIFPPDTPGISWLTKIDGYRVYMVTPGSKPKLLKTIPDQAQKSLDMPFLKTMVFAGTPCFFVRAYAGPLESANSNLYCLGGIPSGLATVTIPLTYGNSGGALKYKTYSLTLCTAGTGSSINTGDSQVVVGFDDDVLPLGSDSCLKWLWEYQRAQFGFDLSAVKGPVSSAQLGYREDFTSAPGQSCARTLGIVTTTTSGTHPRYLAYDPYELLPASGYAGATFKVDATDAVRDWQLGKPNAGFLFVGRNESLPPDDFCGGFGEPGCIEDHSSCWSRYSDLNLMVTYFTSP